MPSVSLDLLRQLTARACAATDALALSCGVPHAALRRALARLSAAGLIEYDGAQARLREAFDFLDARRIADELGGDTEVAVLDACGSTNTELLHAAPHPRSRLLLAEEQTAGRGRRGRRWLAPIGGGLALSLRRDFPRPPRDLAALSLAAGVATARALRALGARETRLKWPNDLLLEGAKLGGILVETRMQGEAVAAVIGIGINMRAAAGLGARLRRRVAALEDCLAPLPSRNAVAARIALELRGVLDAYERSGLAAIRDEWEALDAHRGTRLRVRMSDGSVLAGVAEGIAADGGLRLRTARGLRAVTSGHVILPRAA